MTSFRHSFTVDFPVETVWRFYTDMKHLKIITPRQMNLKILKGTEEPIREGCEYWLGAKLIINSKWHSKITHLSRYEYVDEMSHGMFRKWKHLHRFIEITHNETEIVDQIEFELPFGFVGRLFEGYALLKLAEVFEYRKNATIEALRGLQV